MKKTIIRHSKIIKKKSVFYPLLIWFVLCLATILVYRKELSALKWIDIPTHIVAGIMIAAFIFKAKTENTKRAFLFALIPFLGWEFFEIGAALISQNPFIVDIFQEPFANRVQDLLMDSLGFVIFIIIRERTLKMTLTSE